MASKTEIGALLRLLDDPDEEVYDTVVHRLMLFGKDVIPGLEHMWEVTADESVQTRIEHLIRRVQFKDLQEGFVHWEQGLKPDLMRGAMLVAKLHYPGLREQDIVNRFDQMRRNIWLELNQYLTPMEQVHVFNSILFSYYKLQGHELTERDPKHFFINNVMDSRHGNAFTLGILIVALSEALDVPLFAVDIPRQFLLAYVDVLPGFNAYSKGIAPHILFYFDPASGMVYTQGDVDNYLKKINAHDRESYFKPLTTRKVVYKMMEELCLCYRYRRDEQKADEVMQLMNMIAVNS